MHREYDDIISKLGEPLWYDGNGTPRYSEFSLGKCGIYDDLVVFLRIRCQRCGWEFKVASEMVVMDRLLRSYIPEDWQPTLPNPGEGGIGSFHWGDPPRHEHCPAGETMNCVDCEVLEFWDRRNESRDWKRRAECEGVIEGADEDFREIAW